MWLKYLVRKRALGDVLWVEPVLRKLSEQTKRIVFYTKYPELFENYPAPNVYFTKKPHIAVKLLIRLEQILGTSFATVNLDNAYEQRPKLHFLHAYQLKSGLPISDEYPQLYFSEAEKKRRFVSGPYVVIHLESFSPVRSRQIYGVDWNQVVRYLKQKGLTVVQVGIGANQIPGTQSFNTGIRDLMVLISKSQLFIGIDSGPSHIAACLSIPSLILFGSVNPMVRHFPLLFNGVLMKNACEYDGQEGAKTFINDLPCRLSTGNGIPKCCIFQTEDVISKIDKLITRSVTKNN